MWPDEPDHYKTPIGLKIAILIVIIFISLLIAIPLSIILGGA